MEDTVRVDSTIIEIGFLKKILIFQQLNLLGAVF
jgi:hypothetical protein